VTQEKGKGENGKEGKRRDQEEGDGGIPSTYLSLSFIFLLFLFPSFPSPWP
jgi:hypothetical protein